MSFTKYQNRYHLIWLLCCCAVLLWRCDVAPLELAGYPCSVDEDCAGLTCTNGICGASGQNEPVVELADEPDVASDASLETAPDAGPDEATQERIAERDGEAVREQAKEAPNIIDETGLCQEGQTKPCYSGPANTKGVGTCREGSQRCVKGRDGTLSWGTCLGAVLPAQESCNRLDDDCDGTVDEGLSCERYIPIVSDGDAYANNELTLDPMGNLYVLGRYSGNTRIGGKTLPVPPKPYGLFFSQLKPDGTFGWSKAVTFTTSSSQSDIVTSSTYDNGFLYVTLSLYKKGSYDGTEILSNGLNDCTVAKIDATNGKLLWHRTYGATYHDSCAGVVTDGKGSVYVLGSFGRTVAFGSQQYVCSNSSGSVDLFLLKLNDKGDTQWASCWGADGWDSMAPGGGLTLLANGRIAIAGYINGKRDGSVTTVTFDKLSVSFARQRGFFLQVDPTTGKAQHLATTCTSSPSKYCFIQEIRQDTSGNIAILGTFRGKTEIFGKEMTSSLQGKERSGYVVYGSLDAAGELKETWRQQFLYSVTGRVDDMVIHPLTGDVFVSGFSTGGLEIGQKTYGRALGGSDMFLTQLRQKDGTNRKTFVGGGTAHDTIPSIAIDAKGTIHATILVGGASFLLGARTLNRSGKGRDGGVWSIPASKW